MSPHIASSLDALVCDKEILSRGRFYVVPNMGPSLIVGGPRLNIDQASAFTRANVLPKLAKPAWVHILALKGVLYSGPDREVWPRTLFDVNINDYVYVTTTIVPDNGPATTWKTRCVVVFPFCMEVGPGAFSHELGTLLVERCSGTPVKQHVVCDPQGFGADGKEAVSFLSAVVLT